MWVRFDVDIGKTIEETPEQVQARALAWDASRQDRNLREYVNIFLQNLPENLVSRLK